MKNWSNEKKLENDIKLHKELSYLYEIITKFVIVCLRKHIKLIIENPYSTTHYLVKYWAIPNSVVDLDRSKRGDYYKKPTQFWFINCEPKNNYINEVYPKKERKTIAKTSNSIMRSMISKEYASRFIREYIL